MHRKWLQGLFGFLLIFCFSVFSVVVSAETPGTGSGTTPSSNNKIVPKQNSGYTPPNVDESNARKAKEKQRQKEEQEKAEKKVSEDQDYEAVQKAAENVDKTLEKENPSTKELEQAEEDLEKVEKYVEENQDKKTAQQIQELETTKRNYEEKSAALKEEAEKREASQAYLKKAKETTNPTDLSKLTSYIYLEKGFFGLEDIFPKVVNALVQFVFFLTKTIYCLVVVIIEQVFSTNAYQSLDSVVAFSAKFFQSFMQDYQYVVYGLAVTGALFEFLKTRRFPFRSFRFLLVWLVALFLYQPSSVPLNVGDQNISATYNLSKIVKLVDGVASDMTKMAISSFNEFDPSNASIASAGQGGDKDNLTAVRHQIFQKLVYEPFLSLNFNTTDVSDETIAKLFETNGDGDEVKKWSEDHKDIAQVSWSAIGAKGLVALSSRLVF